jgi:hypothetical protein
MTNVIEFPKEEPVTPKDVLGAAQTIDLTDVIVIGLSKDGSIHFAMSTDDAPRVNWLMDCAKRMLIDGVMEE